MSRPRVAYFSPMPPAASGIADYSAELLPHLDQHVDTRVFAAEPTEAGSPALPPRRFAPDDFDLAVYQIGNNADFHGDIYRQALTVPGLVVVHEYMLHHLLRGLTLGSGDLSAFGEEMRYAYGETGRRAVEQFLDTGVPVDPWPFPLFERLIDRSLGVVVHSRAVEERIRASRPLAAVHRVPHHLAIDELDEDANARSWYDQLGVPGDAPVIGVFGFVTPPKRIDVLIGAFREVVEQHPRAHLAVVGEVSDFYDIDQLRREAPEQVVWSGRLEKPDLLRAMAGCDLAVNLRFPTGGETSGTAIRLLGLGKPLIASDIGWFSEIPRGCAARVPVGRGEHESLVALLSALLTDRDLAAGLGANAARQVRAHNSLAGSAAGYAAAIKATIENRRPIRSEVPPLANHPEQQFGPRLMTSVAQSAADLGWYEDEPALRHLAEIGVDLELDHELDLQTASRTTG